MFSSGRFEKDYELEISSNMDQTFTHDGFINDPRICSFQPSCHELQIDSTAFVYRGSLYMISYVKKLYFIERKGLILSINYKISVVVL